MRYVLCFLTLFTSFAQYSEAQDDVPSAQFQIFDGIALQEARDYYGGITQAFESFVIAKGGTFNTTGLLKKRLRQFKKKPDQFASLSWIISEYLKGRFGKIRPATETDRTLFGIFHEKLNNVFLTDGEMMALTFRNTAGEERVLFTYSQGGGSVGPPKDLASIINAFNAEGYFASSHTHSHPVLPSGNSVFIAPAFPSGSFNRSNKDPASSDLGVYLRPGYDYGDLYRVTNGVETFEISKSALQISRKRFMRSKVGDRP